MKNGFGLLVMGLALLTGCAKSEVPPIEDWITFKSPTAGYSILMPVQPKKQTQSSDGITVDVYVSEANKEFAVVTTAFNFPMKPDLKN